MKHIPGFFVFGLFVSLTISACKKELPLMNTATIVGYDARMAPCTGGTFIKINGHPNPNNTENGYFDIDSIPPSFKINSYPIKVEIDWKISPKCFGNYVVISRIKRIL
jgi:hypothetical protein